MRARRAGVHSCVRARVCVRACVRHGACAGGGGGGPRTACRPPPQSRSPRCTCRQPAAAAESRRRRPAHAPVQGAPQTWSDTAARMAILSSARHRRADTSASAPASGGALRRSGAAPAARKGRGPGAARIRASVSLRILANRWCLFLGVRRICFPLPRRGAGAPRTV